MQHRNPFATDQARTAVSLWALGLVPDAWQIRVLESEHSRILLNWRIAGAPATPLPSARGCRRLGGLDFGFRNPFAAVWGLLDRDDGLWLVGEHYARFKSLDYHVEHLPRDVRWYADPSGARERNELIGAGYEVL